MGAVQLVFPQGKFKALTFSYDDGTLADERLISLFNRYQLKGTFHLCSGWLDEEGKCASSQVAQVYNGHEVACHTVTHPTLTRLPDESIIEEIRENRKHLEQLVSKPVRGFSYPNGAYNTRIKNMLPMLGIDYARVVNATGNFYMPDNWYEWEPTCHHNDDLLHRGEQFIQQNKSQYISLMYVWGHSYEFDRDQNWDVIEQFCERMSEQDNIWFATNEQIRSYVKRYEGLQFSADVSTVYNPFAESVWLRRDNRLYEVRAGEILHLY